MTSPLPLWLLLAATGVAIVACSEDTPSGPKGTDVGAAGTGGGGLGGAAGSGGIPTDPAGGAAGSGAGGGSGGSGGNPGSGGAAGVAGATAAVSLEDFARRWAEAQCSRLERCATIEGVRLLYPHDDCQAQYEARFREQSLSAIAAGVERGSIVYHPERAVGCSEAAAAQPCGELTAYPAACRLAFEGQIAPDEACSTTHECAGEGAHCVGGCSGVCTLLGLVGDPCASPSDCEPGLSCEDSVCAHLPPRSTCNRDGDCLPLQACQGIDGSEICVDYTEAFTVAESAPCLVSTRFLCAPGLSCAAVNEQADQACVGAVASGAECLVSFPDHCPNDEWCDPELHEANHRGVCVPLPLDGEPCAPSPLDREVLDRCGPGHVCLSQVCRRLAVVGEPCVQSGQCFSGRCDTASNRCVAACAAP